MSHPLPTIRLHGVRIHAVTEQQAIGHILQSLDEGQGGWVITPNLDHLRRLSRDPELRQLYDQASLMLADGMPLVWAAKLQGTPLPGRVPGSGLIWSLSEAAARRQRSIYLCGGEPGTAETAANVLQGRFPGLRIAGTACPAPGFENDIRQKDALMEGIVRADPDIIYVALGSPKQELLIAALRERLPKAWWLGVGISFSFVAGHIHRAPVWMQRWGIEWLHRLVQEPGRLARRYLVHGVPFAARLLAEALWARLRRPGVSARI
jgi:N-acetylglucosaminyldiphosphoundecaprenol N-acetyl-beta-D-mannosaminyltransferase